MDKKILKFLLSFIIVFTIILSTQYAEKVFAEKINYEDYIKDIKIIDEQGDVISWFSGARIENNKMRLLIEPEDFPLQVLTDENQGWYLDGKDVGGVFCKLVIETNNIKSIKVDNPFKGKVKVEGVDREIEGIKNFEKSSTEWEKGIFFKEFGAYVEDWGGEASVFSKDAPPKFTFITKDDSQFTLEWEVVNKEEDKSEYDKYIKNIRIINNKEKDEKWFKGYKIKDNKLILVVDKNKLDLFWNWENSGNLKWKDLIIETENIQKIIVNNPINLPANEVWGFISAKGIKNFEATSEEWNKGINFVKLGAYVEGEYWNEYQAFFSKDAPLEFTFITTDGQSFTLPWEAVGYKVEKPEEREIIEIYITPQNSYDDTAKAGIVKEKDGEETLVYSGNYKIGDTVTIKAIDGEKSKFKKWYSTDYYQDPPEGHDPSKYIILEKFIGDINKNELTFTIDEKFKNIKKSSNGKNKLYIDASFDVFNKIYMNTEPENDKLSATVNRDVVPDEEQFTIKAESKDENWIFDEWEMDPPIAGLNTENPDADLTKPKLTLNMVNILIPGTDDSYKLNVTAKFKERDEKLEIEKIEPIVMEVYIGGTYELPKKVEATMTDGSKRMIKVDRWNPPAPYSIDEEKEYSHFGKAQEITMQLKIKGIKKEEKQEYTITFNTNGGSSISSQKVKENKKASRPSDPTKSGYKFVGWYEDSNLTRVFDFNTPIIENVTLYAKWEKTDNPTLTPEVKKEAKITGFNLLGVLGHINHSKETIEVYLPFTMDLDYLVPDISYEGEEISPSIGKPQNFNRIVYYTVSGKNYNSKIYKVYVDMPRDRYDRYDRYSRYDRDTYYDSENWYRYSPESSKKNKDNRDWYEITQEIKKKRLEEEEKLSKDNKEGKATALNEAGRITVQSESEKRDLSITQGNDHMEIKLNSLGKSDYMKNQINIPAGVLTNLNELGFDYLKYSTTLVRIKIFPSMDSADGLYLNIKPAPSNIQSIWKKTKGAGRMFHIETNSTKAGLSFEMKLDKKLPREQIRVVKYNYMKGKFEDISPDKWSIINRRVHVEQISDGIYGIIYKK